MWLYPTNITYFRRYTPFGADPMAEHGLWRPYQPRFQKPSIYFAISENSNTFALPIGRTILPPARMAESVDALVSNTSGAIRAGSIPAPGTRKCKCLIFKHLHFLFPFCTTVAPPNGLFWGRSSDIFTSHPQKPPFSWTAVDF